jgi:ribosome-binding protein aMBF1 (putative translation factor)
VATFEPTDAWQDVPDGAICPPGLHYQIDPNTGLRQARKPQPSVTISDGTPLHERVKAARQARGWSQKQVAEAAGTHQPVISSLENGRTVNDALLARILAALGERP